MWQNLILQMCAAGKDGPGYIKNFQFVKAITCTYADPAGLVTVGLLFYGGIAMALTIRQGSVLMPVVLLLLTGGAILSQIAAPGVSIAGILLLVVGSGVVTLLYYRYSQ